VSRESVRDRLAALSRAELLGLAAFVAIVLAGAGLWYVRSLPRPVEVTASVPTTGFSGPSPSPSPAALVVDVAGWVRHPGVYEFHEGDRVIDAIHTAGGPRDGAALESLNLAAPLADGTQVLVSRRQGGQPAGSAPGGTGASTKININTASAAELDALPSVGEVIAQRIVDYRTPNGPFASVDDLLDVSGIGPVTLEDMRSMVTV
jgi:competence protein ComEA